MVQNSGQWQMVYGLFGILCNCKRFKLRYTTTLDEIQRTQSHRLHRQRYILHLEGNSPALRAFEATSTGANRRKRRKVYVLLPSLSLKLGDTLEICNSLVDKMGDLKWNWMQALFYRWKIFVRESREAQKYDFLNKKKSYVTRAGLSPNDFWIFGISNCKTIRENEIQSHSQQSCLDGKQNFYVL